MIEIWLHTFAIFGLALMYVLMAAKVHALTRALDSMAGWQMRIERLEKTALTSMAKGGWVGGENPLVKEDEWMPPKAKHKDIKS